MVNERGFRLVSFVELNLGKMSRDDQSKAGYWSWLSSWNTPHLYSLTDNLQRKLKIKVINVMPNAILTFITEKNDIKKIN